MMRFLFFLLLSVSSLFAALWMSDYYVSPTGSGSCESSSPCTLQYALTLSGADDLNNTIHLSAGTYVISGGELSFDIDDDTSLTLQGANAANTILDAAYANRILSIERVGIVDDTNVTITLRNLTFTRGMHATLPGNGVNLQIFNARAIVEDCRFIDNGSSGVYGGGLYLTGNGAPYVQILRNIFRNNKADAGGGAFSYNINGHVIFQDNEFSGNTVYSVMEHNGGGLYLWTVDGIANALQNIFFNNNALNQGGAIYAIIANNGSTLMTGNTIVQNQSGNCGGGVYINMGFHDVSSASLYNNIIWDNSASGCGDGLYVYNVGNSGTGATCNLSYNVIDAYRVQNTTHFTHEYNIGENPRITGKTTRSDGRKSIRLFAGSPAINTGNSCISGVQATDYEGNPRVVDTYINIGAVESIVPLMPPIYYLLLN